MRERLLLCLFQQVIQKKLQCSVIVVTSLVHWLVAMFIQSVSRITPTPQMSVGIMYANIKED